jgi:hypothetical protein
VQQLRSVVYVRERLLNDQQYLIRPFQHGGTEFVDSVRKICNDVIIVLQKNVEKHVDLFGRHTLLLNHTVNRGGK